MTSNSNHFRPRDLYDDPECILAIGHQGAGKSSGWMDIALRCYLTGSSARFHVMDTTREVRALIQRRDKYRGLLRYDAVRDKIVYPDGNVDLCIATNWKDQSTWLQKTLPEAGPDDWVVPEMVHGVWQAISDDFSIRHYGKSVNDLVVDARDKVGNTGDKRQMKTLDRNMDWNPITAEYNRDFAIPLFTAAECNVYATARTKPMSDDEKEEVRKLFGRYGVKPAGQKELPFQAHTVLMLEQKRDKSYTVITVKDKGREYLEEEPWEDLAETYLLDIAKWKWGKEVSKNLEAVS